MSTLRTVGRCRARSAFRRRAGTAIVVSSGAGSGAAIDDALQGVEAQGGSTVQPRTEIPGMGAFAYFKDSEGNVMGLWETTT